VKHLQQDLIFRFDCAAEEGAARNVARQSLSSSAAAGLDFHVWLVLTISLNGQTFRSSSRQGLSCHFS
jgi:hypothetical protein